MGPLGFISTCFVDYLCTFDDAAAERVLASTGHSINAIYSNSHWECQEGELSRIITAAVAVLDVVEAELCRHFGSYCVTYIQEQGQDILLQFLGSSPAKLLTSLCFLEPEIGLPLLLPPDIQVQQTTSTSLLLQCSSPTHADLWAAWLEGFVPEVISQVFGTVVGMDEVHTNAQSHMPQHYAHHKAWHVQLLQPQEQHHQQLPPTQDDLRTQDQTYSSIVGLPPEQFYNMFPFHFVMDLDLHVLQAGAALKKACPQLSSPGLHIGQAFQILHPARVPWSSLISLDCQSKLILASRTGLELVGTLVHTHLMTRALPGAEAQEVLLFVGSARMSGLSEARQHDLCLPDLAVHDLSADFIMLAEQYHMIMEGQDMEAAGGGAPSGDEVGPTIALSRHAPVRRMPSRRTLSLQPAQQLQAGSSISGGRSPADSAIQLMDRLLAGSVVSPQEVAQVRDALLKAGGNAWQLLSMPAGLDLGPSEEVQRSMSQLLMSHRPTEATNPAWDFTTSGRVPVGGKPARPVLPPLAMASPLPPIGRSKLCVAGSSPDTILTASLRHVMCQPAHGDIDSSFPFLDKLSTPPHMGKCSSQPVLALTEETEEGGLDTSYSQTIRSCGSIISDQNTSSSFHSFDMCHNVPTREHRPSYDSNLASPATGPLSIASSILAAGSVHRSGPLPMLEAACLTHKMRRSSSTAQYGGILPAGVPLTSSRRRASGLLATLNMRKSISSGNFWSLEQEHLTDQDYSRQRQPCPKGKYPRGALLTLFAEPPDPLATVLSGLDAWQFDSFSLEEASNGHPLSVLAFALFKQMALIPKLGLDETKLARFLIRVEDGYSPNPYHSSTHAADVLRTLHVILTRGGVLAAASAASVTTVHCVAEAAPQKSAAAAAAAAAGGTAASDGGAGQAETIQLTSLLVSYLSAIIHDFDHRGVNNDFLVQTSDPLALLYNDTSPQENHHVAAAFLLMRDRQYNFLHSVPTKLREVIRKRVIEQVLATDMRQHFAIIGLFSSKVISSKQHQPPSPSRDGRPVKRQVSGVGKPRVGRLPSFSIHPEASGAHHLGTPTGMRCSVGRPLSRGLISQALASGTSDSGAVQLPQLSPSNSPNSSTAAAATASSRFSRPGSGVLMRCSGAGDMGLSGRLLQPCSPGSAGLSCQRMPLETAMSADHTFSNSPSSLGAGLVWPTTTKRSGTTAAAVASEPPPVWDDETLMLVFKFALKCADLGHLTSSREVHKKWVAQLEEELFQQGDQERALGMPVSPLMDRTGAGITKSQTIFFNLVAKPMYQALAQVFPSTSPLLTGLTDNYHYWSELEAAVAADADAA